LVWDLKCLLRNPHLIRKFLGDCKLIKITAAGAVEEFAVLQTLPLILKEGKGCFLMIPIILKNTEKH